MLFRDERCAALRRLVMVVAVVCTIQEATI